MSMEAPPIEQVRLDVEKSPNPRITLDDLTRVAKKIDDKEGDNLCEEHIDDLKDSAKRYLNSVLHHVAARDRSNLTDDWHDQDREEAADQSRRRTHNGLISKFDITIRLLGEDHKITGWYKKSIMDSNDAARRRKIGLWAMKQALQLLEEDNENN